MEKEEKIVVETQNSEDETIIIEETDDDDNEFLKSLEEIDDEEKGDEPNEEAKAEALRIKNKNAEEARKRRESEAKAKAEAKAKEEAQVVNEESKEITPQQQVKDLITKYPNLDLGELDTNENFQEYLQGKWVKGGKSITEIYEAYLGYEEIGRAHV